MGTVETIVFFSSLIFLFLFLWRWYPPLFKVWPEERNKQTRIVLGFLPVIFLIALFSILRSFASFDVVDDIEYIFFYIVLGYAWMYIGLMLMPVCFGLFWPDDAIHLNNKAVLPVIIGEFFALAAIYAGANVGDGPGWWCVLFAGGLGLAAWLILNFVIHFCTDIFERVIVERDLGCGIRFCVYLLLCGIILGRACSGDWTSFSKTVEEFAVGWPVLPLTGVMILIELLCKQKAKLE